MTKAGSTTTTPASSSPGWLRRCNLGTGDFNNDLTTSDTPGDVWSCSFTGSSVSVIAPKEAGAGKIEVQIDGQTRATADLSTTGARQAQQRVCEVTGLTPGKHSITIVNRGPGPVARGCPGHPLTRPALAENRPLFVRTSSAGNIIAPVPEQLAQSALKWISDFD